VVAIAERLIANIEADTTDCGGTLYRGDGSMFTDPERFARERRLLFRRTPQVLGWAGELARPGDVVARVLAGVPVVATRTEDGDLRAFLNACTHRGMAVAQGCDHTRRLTCPYHGWTFDLAGRLVGLPHRDRFPGLDPDGHGLTPLPVTSAAGLVAVGLEPDVAVDGCLDDLVGETEWLGYDRYRGGYEVRLVKRANWKLMFDVNIEAYHVPSLHRLTLMPFLADHCTVDHFGPHSRLVVPFKGLEALADRPRDEWPDRLDSVMVTSLFPSTVLVDHMQGGSMLQIHPGSGPGETVITLTEARPVDGDLDEATRTECRETMDVNLSILDAEDFPAAESCQRGYEAGARSVVGGIGESLIGWWHTRWDAALTGG
jgi:nitrite reductase/ring-hydroxylating ferredoxin subunit